MDTRKQTGREQEENRRAVWIADTDRLEARIGHRFADRALLREALTHSTYAHEVKQKSQRILPCNERLEFFGDAVLSLLVSTFLYTKYPDKDEGALTNLRKFLVCRDAFAGYSRELDLGSYLYLGHGESLNGRQNASTLENAFEALAAAVYLDEEREGRDGRAAVEHYLLPLLEEKLTHYGTIETIQDYKTLLQEIVQRAREDTLAYVQVGESGPDHCKTFTVEARLNDSILIGRGSGRTKREAEQAAAKQAITDYFHDFASE